MRFMLSLAAVPKVITATNRREKRVFIIIVVVVSVQCADFLSILLPSEHVQSSKHTVYVVKNSP